ncbi:MAG: 4-hydroxythreonine-4-phosphate dehydrogenase PdxA [Flavobacteriales bacterium]|nr:4-hydroxythreonine-4-phosphate dehydrogenase PdxA [Flavobacteriales bacterium]
MSKGKRVKVGISIGDTNGIGLEVVIKSFLDNRVFDSFIPIIYASKDIVKAHRKKLGIEDFSFNFINDPDEASPKKANLISVWKESAKVSFGEPTKESGEYALRSLEAAVNDLASNKVDVLVTAPINKKNIHSDKFNFPGHTEYLAKFANTDDVLMFMISENIRIGVVTGHIPVNEVAKSISKEAILKKLEIMEASLKRDFNIVKPKIAVLGLNPHAGDEGLLGKEEIDIISPAIESAKSNGILAFGPYPADGFFGSSNFKNFDGILAMYHDQGLIPFKALTFENGINFTAGLPIVRTSPDHGTAYEIAGQNKASASSFRTACYTAVDIYRNRTKFKKMRENALDKPKTKEVKVEVSK